MVDRQKFPFERKSINFDGQPTTIYISRPHAMMSAAGWYVGESYWDLKFGGFEGPYNRLSGYYATREEVEKILPTFMED